MLWLAVRRWCHTFMCTCSINSGSSLSWQRKLMISFMVPTKPDWSGLVLSTQNLSYNSEFVHLPSWYRPQVSDLCSPCLVFPSLLWPYLGSLSPFSSFSPSRVLIMFQVCLVFPSLVLSIYSVFCPLFPVGCYMSFGVCLTLFSLFPELIIKSIVKITPRLLALCSRWRWQQAFWLIFQRYVRLMSRKH